MPPAPDIVEDDLKMIISAPLPWERFAGKTMLVTGASGFIANYFIRSILFLNATHSLDCRVVGLVRNIDKARQRFGINPIRSLSLVQADVSDSRSWSERFDFIVHAASQASPKFYGPDPVGTMNANLLGCHHLLNKARHDHSEGFLFISSGEVYGQVSPDKIPTKESDYGYIDVTDPRSCYAESKRATETLGVSHHHQYGTPFVIARPFHTYGPGMALDDGRVFADFVSDVVHDRSIQLRSDGSAVRAFCYLADAVAGLFTVLLRGSAGTAYNVGNPSAALSIAELADLLAGIRNNPPLQVIRTVEQRSGYLRSPISKNIPDVARLVSLGWQPTFSLREGFARTIEYFLQ